LREGAKQAGAISRPLLAWWDRAAMTTQKARAASMESAVEVEFVSFERYLK
jgi:hypothetical protein